MCLKSRVVMCPVVSELVAEGEQAINTSLFSTYVVSWSLIKLFFRTWPLSWQIKAAFLLLIWVYSLKKKGKVNLPACAKCFKLGCPLKRHVLRGSESLIDYSRRKIVLPLFGVDFWRFPLERPSPVQSIYIKQSLLNMFIFINNVLKHLVLFCTVHGCFH